MKAPNPFSAWRTRERSRTPLNIPPISLLSPTEANNPAPSATRWQHDLDLETLVGALSRDRRYQPFIRSVLAALTPDPQAIAWRQGVLADLLANPLLVTELEEKVLPLLADMAQGHSLFGERSRSLLLETSDRLSELEIYTSAVQQLYEALDAASLQSPALIQLRTSLDTLRQNDSFIALCAELPELRAPLQNIASLTIGVNLDLELRPKSAALLAINDEAVREPLSLLNRLIGTRTDEDDLTGLAPLHHLPADPSLRKYAPLYQDLAELLSTVAQPIAQALRRYVKTSSTPIVRLENELAFYVAAVCLMRQLTGRGIALCQPEIAPTAERLMQIDGLVNINLAIKQPTPPVPSDVTLDDTGRIAVLTGPNSGGKTTYLQSVGLAQVLFQAGLFIPAQKAHISPVRELLTHFPALESGQQGRLAEEATRLRTIFQQMSAHSLILLNETFSSTSSGEAVYLAQDMLGGFRALGVRALYATHLVELIAHLEAIEALTAGPSRLVSLVAGIALNTEGEAVPTLQITRDQPLGRSYAQEIAQRHGISLAQILQLRPKADDLTDNSNTTLGI